MITSYIVTFSVTSKSGVLQTLEYEISQFLLSADDLVNLNFSSDGFLSDTGYGCCWRLQRLPQALAGLGVFGTDPEFDDATSISKSLWSVNCQFGFGLTLPGTIQTKITSPPHCLVKYKRHRLLLLV
jgi:hypothetical protein